MISIQKNTYWVWDWPINWHFHWVRPINWVWDMDLLLNVHLEKIKL